MRNVVDQMPNTPEECLYSYKNMLGTVKCRLSKKECTLMTREETGETECSKLTPLDDTLKDALKAYTKILDKKIK